MEGELCRLPVESQRMYSLFAFYIFAKPDNVTSRIEWLEFPGSNTLNNQYFVNTFRSVGESCGSPIFFCSIENKRRAVLIPVANYVGLCVCRFHESCYLFIKWKSNIWCCKSPLFIDRKHDAFSKNSVLVGLV